MDWYQLITVAAAIAAITAGLHAFLPRRNGTADHFLASMDAMGKQAAAEEIRRRVGAAQAEHYIARMSAAFTPPQTDPKGK